MINQPRLANSQAGEFSGWVLICFIAHRLPSWFALILVRHGIWSGLSNSAVANICFFAAKHAAIRGIVGLDFISHAEGNDAAMHDARGVVRELPIPRGLIPTSKHYSIPTQPLTLLAGRTQIFICC